MKTLREGTQLNAMPSRAMTPGVVDSAVARSTLATGVTVPGDANGSTPFSTLICTTLPSASTATKTARPVRSGDLVTMAVPRAAVVRPAV